LILEWLHKINYKMNMYWLIWINWYFYNKLIFVKNNMMCY
jgi:hypothetical protein